MVYGCADCRARHVTLYNCADGLKRCQPHKMAFDIQQARAQAETGAIVVPPRVG
jgi:hypothetical protein